ncbi:hypothetical protein NECAME_11715 [Necator americanus]|uniref:Uncharacterized protein n=1 Tax=Necator americanus TaxID=51031 RepID=W2T496_NECAM|nr:hypothetical protein NECAME_11715 [Necator americanus]ETN76384.1 hypothetical protein NECAME_11715 [Necator americanus]
MAWCKQSSLYNLMRVGGIKRDDGPQSKINSKRRRGVDPIPAGTNLSVDPNSAAYVEATVEQEPCLRRTAKRKIRTSSIPQFAHHSNDMSGPSFLAHVAEDASVGDGVDSSHGEASSDINFEDLNFLE